MIKIAELRSYHEKHKEHLSLVAFVFGFGFDILMAQRIDDVKMLIQQGCYLLLIAIYLRFEVLNELKPFEPKKIFSFFWKYREPIVHFFFGTLLNFNSIFYFKSASLSSSFLFFIFLCALIAANELPMLRRYGLSLRFTLWSLCLSSYLAILLPILFGSIGALPFILACALSCAILLVFVSRILKNLPLEHPIRRRVVVPGLLVILVFVSLYVFQLIPPVPLSVTSAGVYHSIKKEDGHYALSSLDPGWKFWKKGDSVFLARPGDKIYFFAQIFSPTRFSDQIYIHWLYHDSRSGWQSSDKIALAISGGREQGYRGYAFKSNFFPGSWRIQVESSDGREISRLPIEVVNDTSTAERVFKVIEK
jgi:hypothetical protein